MTEAASVEVSRGRVLLADDQPVHLREMAQLLRDVGFDCECMSDPTEIRNALDQGIVDVLVADIRMPGNVNLELVEHVRSSPSRPSVILMTRERPRTKWPVQTPKRGVSMRFPSGGGGYLARRQKSVSQSAGFPATT